VLTRVRQILGQTSKVGLFITHLGIDRGGPAMKSALIVASLLVLGFTGQAQAQEPSGRIDLDVVSGSPQAKIVVVRVGFVENDRDCPERQHRLRIAKATLTQLEVRMPTDPGPHYSQTAGKPGDDETQLYQIATPTCRTEIAIRQQVRKDGAWVSLLVPRFERPSVPSDERREVLRQLTESRRAQAQTPEARELLDRFMAADKALRAAGSLSPVYATRSIWAFVFEDKPEACFEAIGDYRIERTGVTFSFMTDLPGDLNRFAIERADPDPNRARLFFTRGDCRFELTISQSILQNSGQIAVPVAPLPATKG
jgi:hypothetical protein